MVTEVCEHTTVFEYVKNGHYQHCPTCNMIRYYNPKKKRDITTVDPELWSNWEIEPNETIVPK
jgi:hypothetical protein